MRVPHRGKMIGNSAASLEALVNDEGGPPNSLWYIGGREVLGAGARLQTRRCVGLTIGCPGISGYDIARILRKTFGSSKPTLIAVTCLDQIRPTS